MVERIAYLFNSTAMCDVRFVVGRDAQRQVVPAHKFVLSIGSAVFDAMFNSSLSSDVSHQLGGDCGTSLELDGFGRLRGAVAMGFTALFACGVH